MRPSCIKFLPGNENYALIGMQNGEVQLFDTRKPKDCLARHSTLEHAVTKLNFCPQNKSRFGVCIESSPLQILDLDESLTSFQVKYKDSRHDDFVRDLAWQPNAEKVFSCGWDHKVLSHTF